jgi:YidC/Oxa1 family membrane protein insertase
MLVGLFNTPALQANMPTSIVTGVEMRDIDNDNLPDAILNTPHLKVIISSKDGNIALFYLKGINYEENLYPPLLANFGYSFASDTLAPFSLHINRPAAEKDPAPSYSLSQDKAIPDKLVIVATPNSTPGQLNVLKRYAFRPTGYVFETELILTNFGEADYILGNAQLAQPGLQLRYGPGLFLDPFNPSTFIGLKPGAQDNFDTADTFNAGVKAGGYTGFGLKTTYFCALAEYKEAVTLSAKGFPVKPDVADSKKKEFVGQVVEMSLPPFVLKGKESKAFTFSFYFGPKLLDELLAIKRDQVTDYGFLSTVLLRILQFFHGIYPNYGLAIIFLTIVVRIALYPLTVSQTKSMAKMQKIQPLVQDIKDRYRDEPQRFNEEVLKLYQKHQVNPLGGCLPLLLQLPVLIALYNTINICVELRKTSFLWITDLSKADPILLLPIAITAMMYYQQGKVTDPQQQQMMAFMPMFMFIITWSLPSGLLIYWFISTVAGVLQQIHANRITMALKEE